MTAMLLRLVRCAALATAVVAVLVVIGCELVRQPLEPSASATVSSEALAEAIRFRSEYGLRADEAWVLGVLESPLASTDEFPVPLMPFEIQELQQRARTIDAVAEEVRLYGALHPGSYAGLYIDQKAGGLIVARFVGDPNTHTAALRARLHPAARFVVREAQFTLSELEALRTRIEADAAWFDSIGVTHASIADDVVADRLQLHVQSADPSVVEAVRAHYAAGEMLSIVWDSNVVARLPRGAIRGTVVDEGGRPLSGLDIVAVGDIDDAEPDGGVGYVTDAAGMFHIPALAAMGWELQVLRPVPNAASLVIGSARVVVVGGETAVVRIVVHEVQRSSP